MTKEYFNEWRKATKGEDPTTSESEDEEESQEQDDKSSNEKEQMIEPEKTLTLMQTVPDIEKDLNYQGTFNGQNPLLTQTTTNND